jgi:phosphoserine phosphatase RsbU/P
MSSRSKLGRYQEELHADLKLAELVHSSMIPRDELRGDLELACRFIPMVGVGGDYASVFFQSPSRVFVGISDVSGHGVAAALLVSRINSFVLSQAPGIDHPCHLGESLNRFFFDYFGRTGQFLSFFCLYLDLEQGSLTYAGFGHPPVFLCAGQEDRPILLESRNTFIGIASDLVQTCTMDTARFAPDDRLILYTDGLYETQDEEGEILGIPRLQDLVTDHLHLPLPEQLDAVIGAVGAFRGSESPDDDQLLLGIEFAGKEGREKAS